MQSCFAIAAVKGGLARSAVCRIGLPDKANLDWAFAMFQPTTNSAIRINPFFDGPGVVIFMAERGLL